MYLPVPAFLTQVRSLLASLEQAPKRIHPVPLPNLVTDSILPPHTLCTSDTFLPQPDPELTCFLHQSQLDDLTNIVSKALTAALVLHPIACVLAFISLVVTIFALLRRRRHFQLYGTESDGRSRFTPIISFAIILLAALFTTIVFVVDVVLVAVARGKIRDALGDNQFVHLTWGSAVSPDPSITENNPVLTPIFGYTTLPSLVSLGLDDSSGSPCTLVRALRYHLSFMWEPTPTSVRGTIRSP